MDSRNPANRYIRFNSKLDNRLSYRGESASSTLRCQTCLLFKCSCPASMESKVRLTNIAGSFFAGYVKGEVLPYFGLSRTRCWWKGRRHWSMFSRYCICTTFRDRKGARWLTPQLLPSASPVKRRLVQLHGTKSMRYYVTNDSSTIKFVGDYFCHRFLSTTSINHCTPTRETGQSWAAETTA